MPRFFFDIVTRSSGEAAYDFIGVDLDGTEDMVARARQLHREVRVAVSDPTIRVIIEVRDDQDNLLMTVDDVDMLDRRPEPSGWPGRATGSLDDLGECCQVGPARAQAALPSLATRQRPSKRHGPRHEKCEGSSG